MIRVAVLVDGELCLFMLDGQSYVKEKAPDGFVSHNHNYKKITITPDSSFYCYGKVLGVREI